MTNQAVGLNNYATGENSRYPELWRGCVGAWAMCLGPTGTRLFDFSGRQNWGTLTNMDAATDWVVSGGQYALDFDGVDDRVAFTPIALSSAFTVSLWYNRRTLVGGFGNYLLGNSVNTQTRLPFLRANDVFLRTDGGVTSSYSHITTNNIWYHLLLTRTIGNSQRCFINGIDLGTRTLSGTYTVDWIGSGSEGPTSYNHDGRLDDIRIYNRALLDSEIYLLSRRRGIAYECRRRRRVNEQAAAAALNAIYATRQTQLIGGGLL